MKLPGQSRHASKKLGSTLDEIQEGLGHKIVFLPLQNYPNRRLRDTVRGYHDSDDGVERIWLDFTMPYAEQEAVAAHELAHIMQDKDGYPRVFSVKNLQEQPLLDSLERLAARTNNLVMDESADLWAIKHGFDLKKVFSRIRFDDVISAINGNPAQKEAADWKMYYAGLRKIARELKEMNPVRDGFAIGAEAVTQGLALDYAALSLRMGRYGLFDKLDRFWANRWPVSRSKGKELADIVKANGTANPGECRRTFEEILAFLRIPAPLISIRQAPIVSIP